MDEENLEQVVENPIITPYDQERWALLEVPSHECDSPLSPSDIGQIERMDTILTELGDEAAGLAAVQIGYPRRIFLLRRDGENKVYINPTYTYKSQEKKNFGEACLSLPGVHARFKRSKTVTIEYLDLDGNQNEETFTGFWARAVQHEMDHLDGTLITYHLDQTLTGRTPHKVFKQQEGFMKLTPQRRKAIARRRAANKRAKKARKANR
jgi:peptide deformylase